MSFSSKEKKPNYTNVTNTTPKKKRTNWNQTLKSTVQKAGNNKTLKVKKSLQYILLLKKFKNVIDFKNIKLLKAFLTKYGKIKARRKTRIPVQKQRSISKAIRKARSFGLIPFTYDLKI
jgi:small subunit ribosomal protein S18